MNSVLPFPLSTTIQLLRLRSVPNTLLTKHPLSLESIAALRIILIPKLTYPALTTILKVSNWCHPTCSPACSIYYLGNNLKRAPTRNLSIDSTYHVHCENSQAPSKLFKVNLLQTRFVPKYDDPYFWYLSNNTKFLLTYLTTVAIPVPLEMTTGIAFSLCWNRAKTACHHCKKNPIHYP